MRILTLSWEYPPVVYGGLGRHLHALAEWLVRTGHEVTVVTQHAPGAAYDEVVNGVRIVRVPDDPPLVPRGDLLTWVLAFNHALGRAALQVSTRSAYDVVHAHDWLVAHAATMVKDGAQLPLVATMHATEAGRHQGWLPSEPSRAIHTIEWWLTYEARRIITCSAHMRWEVTRLFELPPDKVDVVANGIDVSGWRTTKRRAAAERARLTPAGGPLLVYAGRLEYEKGVQTLLRALPRLRRRHPGIRLVIAGSGPYEAELRRLASSLRLGSSVAFLGFLEAEALAPVLAAGDVAIVPSIYEPFGMVALEAAAAGTPLVAADTGGLREIVEHEVTGLRFAPQDHAALADAVSAILSDEVLGRRLVRQGRRGLRELAWSTLATRTADVYERAIREERALRSALPSPSQRSLRVVVAEGNLLSGDTG